MLCLCCAHVATVTSPPRRWVWRRFVGYGRDRLSNPCAIDSRAPVPFAGVYQFFLVFLTSMVGLQLLHGCLRIICAGYMPKLFLVAAAHSVSPSTVLTRVIRRRHARQQIPDRLCTRSESGYSFLCFNISGA
jgi:hypothetical protein